MDLYLDGHVSYEEKTIAWRVKFCVLTKLLNFFPKFQFVLCKCLRGKSRHMVFGST